MERKTISLPHPVLANCFGRYFWCLQHFGYCKINLPEFGEVRGHEFHYSHWLEETNQANLWEVSRHSTGISRKEGYRTANLHASYVHLYFPQAASLVREVLQLVPDESAQY